MYTADHAPMYIAAKWTEGKLLSVGVVSESGAAFYGETSDYFINEDMSEGRDGGNFLGLMWHHMNSFRSEYKADAESVFGYTSRYTADGHTNRLLKATSSVVKAELWDWMDAELWAINGSTLPIVLYTDGGIFEQNRILQIVSKDENNRTILRNHISDTFMDLNTIMSVRGYGRSFSRERLIAADDLTKMVKSAKPFSDMGDKLMKTALWDAVRIKLCFDHICNQLGSMVFGTLVDASVNNSGKLTVAPDGEVSTNAPV